LLWAFLWLAGGARAQTARPGLAQPLALRWRYESTQTINLTPAVEGERVYVPLAGGELLALQAADGSLLWKTDNGGEISCTPVADAKAVFVASEALPTTAAHHSATPKAYVRAVNRETGITLWARQLPAPLYGLLVANDSSVFGVSADGAVYAFNKTTGETLWEARHAATLSSDITLAGNRLYVGGKDGVLLALDATTGNLVWRFTASGGARGRILAEKGALFFSTDNGGVYALSEAGELRWRTHAGASVQTLALAPDGLLAASFDNSLYGLDLIKGKRIWRRQLGSRVAGDLLATAEGVLLTSITGNLATVLDPRNGKQLNTLSLGDDTSAGAAPVLAQGVIVVTGRKGLLAFANPNK
jgi:outer membrane protein assembly factor BamB